METEPVDRHPHIEKLLTETRALLVENNQLLKKQEKRAIRGFWFKIIWFVVLIVLPIILWPFMISTLMSSMGLSDASYGSDMSQTLKNAQETLRLLQNP